MPDFRYAQFCPLARAAEILGERWTLLVVRELWTGPQRFSDLRRRLPGVSASVLSERLGRMQERGLVARREVGPPTPAVLYELGPAGRALLPAMEELARWGLRFLGPPQPGEHFEPEWLRVGLQAFARRAPTPARRFALRVAGGERELEIRVAGGAGGTVVDGGNGPVDAAVRADPLVLLGILSGGLDPASAVRSGQVEVTGDARAVADLPRLFDMQTPAPIEKQ